MAHSGTAPAPLDAEVLLGHLDHFSKVTDRLFGLALRSARLQNVSDFLVDAELAMMMIDKPAAVARLARDYAKATIANPPTNAAGTAAQELHTALTSALSYYKNSEASSEELRDARNVLEHFDDYIRGKGHSALHWGVWPLFDEPTLVVGHCSHSNGSGGQLHDVAHASACSNMAAFQVDKCAVAVRDLVTGTRTALNTASQAGL